MSQYNETLESALYVAVNKESYPLEHLNPDYSILFEMSIEEIIALNIDDNLLYFVGYNNAEKDSKNIMMASAKQGNRTAAIWLIEHIEEGPVEMESLFLSCFEGYLKYLKKDNDVNWRRVYDFIDRFGQKVGSKKSYVRHEILMSLVKQYKRYALHYLDCAMSEVWDKTVIDDCRIYLDNYIKTHKKSLLYEDKKLIKQIMIKLDQLKVQEGLYSIQDNPIWQLAQEGCFDNLQHYYKSPKEPFEVKIGGGRKGSESCNSSSSASISTSNRKSSVKTGDFYVVGQEIGDGYVFFVNETKKHGLIVSKKYHVCTPSNVYKLLPSRGKWRLPKLNELMLIYKELKVHFPVASYLIADKDGFLSYKETVVFNKKKCYYTNSIYRDQEYHVLLVTSF